MAVLLAGQVLMGCGFVMRAAITGWIPVASMFETVVFVSLSTALLGIWFSVGPLFWSWRRLGLGRAMAQVVERRLR